MGADRESGKYLVLTSGHGDREHSARAAAGPELSQIKSGMPRRA